jgi:hypothetical protein
MRCVDKGINATVYRNYRDACTDLVGRLGLYCSYCEMPIGNEPDVEHVQPKSLGGAALDWENFLLGCKKCNKIKNNKNPNRINHLWPDEDNTFVAFEYYNEIFIRPIAANLSAAQVIFASNTLELTGLDRVPKNLIAPTKLEKKDYRWQNRRKAWDKANRALANWTKNPSPELLESIADTAESTGYYSIWAKFFSAPANLNVLHAIKAKFLHTYDPVRNPANTGYTLRNATSRF